MQYEAEKTKNLNGFLFDLPNDESVVWSKKLANGIFSFKLRIITPRRTDLFPSSQFYEEENGYYWIRQVPEAFLMSALLTNRSMA